MLGAYALVVACLVTADTGSVAKEPLEPTSQSMRFEWHVNGQAGDCGLFCQKWISATGTITDNTEAEFQAFAEISDLRGATLILDSEGGSVRGAIALGRAIRRLEMTTSIGRTKVFPPDSPGIRRAEVQPDTRCESMCVMLLLGGIRRHVPPEAHVLVHQIWIGSKRGRAREASYTADELELVQRDIGSLARFVVEMGCESHPDYFLVFLSGFPGRVVNNPKLFKEYPECPITVPTTSGH